MVHETEPTCIKPLHTLYSTHASITLCRSYYYYGLLILLLSHAHAVMLSNWTDFSSDISSFSRKLEFICPSDVCKF